MLSHKRTTAKLRWECAREGVIAVKGADRNAVIALSKHLNKEKRRGEGQTMSAGVVALKEETIFARRA